MSYNEWLDMDVLEDYLDGKLDAKMMHQVEKLSLEDPFVAEALAGLSQSPKRSQSLSLLQKQLRDRVAQKPVEKKMWTITSQRLSIAATAAVLFVTVSLLFYMRENNRREALAKQDKNIDVAIAPQVATTKPQVPKAPLPEIEAEIDKALVNTKTKVYAKNKSITSIADKITPAIEESVIVATNGDDTERKKENNRPLSADKSAIDQELVLLKGMPENRSNFQSLEAKTKGLVFTPNTFTGRVVSNIDGLPIPGANVKLLNTDIETRTNAKGEFSIRKDSIDKYNLAVNSVGFFTKEMKVSSNQFSIALEPANNSLSEVVIVDLNKNGVLFSPGSSGAEPIKGLKDYEIYIKSNKQLSKPKTGSYEFILNFEIAKDGTPDNILVQGIKEHVVTAEEIKYRTEAVRLLKAGPKWKYNSTPIRRGELKITF